MPLSTEMLRAVGAEIAIKQARWAVRKRASDIKLYADCYEWIRRFFDSPLDFLRWMRNKLVPLVWVAWRIHRLRWVGEAVVINHRQFLRLERNGKFPVIERNVWSLRRRNHNKEKHHGSTCGLGINCHLRPNFEGLLLNLHTIEHEHLSLRYSYCL